MDPIVFYLIICTDVAIVAMVAWITRHKFKQALKTFKTKHDPVGAIYSHFEQVSTDTDHTRMSDFEFNAKQLEARLKSSELSVDDFRSIRDKLERMQERSSQLLGQNLKNRQLLLFFDQRLDRLLRTTVRNMSITDIEKQSKQPFGPKPKAL